MKVLIVGATSAIAQETAKWFAREEAELLLAGRNPDRLQAVAEDLRVRNAARVETRVIDITCVDHHREWVEEAVGVLGGLDAVLIACGVLPDQQECEKDEQKTLRAFAVNCTGVIALLTILAAHCDVQGHGRIAVITSVAGDRGRGSNYVYGAAKGALNCFLEGLRARLYRAAVSVTTLKVGPVETPMTEGLPKNLLFAKPASVAKAIYRAMLDERDVAYIPWFWKWIMLAIRCIPESLFKRIQSLQ